MKSRPVLFACLLLVCCFSPVKAGSRRPGAKAPVGPPPGGVPVAHTKNDVNAHLDCMTRRLERLLKQSDSPAPGSTSGSFSNSTIGMVPGTKPANHAGKPAPPHHLIGDPPLPSSFADLAGLDNLPGTRRPGSRPAAYPTTHSPPHHLIGDPPTWPDDLGTYLYSIWDPGDDRALLPGEVNLYTGPLNSSGYPSNPIYWQTVFNWNPTTGIGRNVSWIYQQPLDPSTVYFYYYSPAPVTPPPAPAINPTRTEQGASVSGNPNDPHIYLGPSQANPLAGVLSSQSGEVATAPLSGQSGTVQTAAENSYVTYYGGSGSPGASGSGSNTTLVGFSPEDFADDSGAYASIPSSDVSDFIPDISPVSSQTVLAALVGPTVWSSDGSSSGGASTAGTTPSVQAQGQTNGTLSNASPEAAAPAVQENPNPESGDVYVAQISTGSDTQGSGSALPWGLGLAGLLVGAGALAGARKVMSRGQNDTNSDEVWVDPNPPSPEQQAKDLNLEAATLTYQDQIRADQEVVQWDTETIQYDTQLSQEGSSAISQATQEIQQDNQKLQPLEKERQPLLNEIQKYDDVWEEAPPDEGVLDAYGMLPGWRSDQALALDLENVQYDIQHNIPVDSDVPAAQQDDDDDLENDYQVEDNLENDVEYLDPADYVAFSEDMSVDLNQEVYGFDYTEIDPLQNDINSEQSEISTWSDVIPYCQNDESNMQADITQLQADENTAHNQYEQAVQDDSSPDPNWDPLSPAPANDPYVPGSNDNSPPDPNWDPLSPSPANPDDSGQPPDSSGQQGSPVATSDGYDPQGDNVVWPADLSWDTDADAQALLAGFFVPLNLPPGWEWLQDYMSPYDILPVPGAAAVGSDAIAPEVLSWAKKLGLNVESTTTQSLLQNLNMSVSDFIGKFRKGGINSVIPGEYLNMSVREALEKGGSTIRKLLTDRRFQK